MILLLLLAWVLAGAIVNVAVAWGCVAIDVDHQPTRTRGVFDNWFVSIRARAGALRLDSDFEGPTNRREGSDVPEVVAERVRNDLDNRIPRWSRVRDSSITSVASAFEDYEFEDGRGWPALALRSAFDWDSYDFKQQSERRFGVYPSDELIRSPEFIKSVGFEIALGDCVKGGFLIKPPGVAMDDYRALPACPIWPGFAINTVFYALVLWLLFAAPFALPGVRRRRRIKRGLCPKCAYDLRGTQSEACPECGATVKPTNHLA